MESNSKNAPHIISPKELNLFPAVVFIRKIKRIKDRIKRE